MRRVPLSDLRVLAMAARSLPHPLTIGKGLEDYHTAMDAFTSALTSTLTPGTFLLLLGVGHLLAPQLQPTASTSIDEGFACLVEVGLR